MLFSFDERPPEDASVVETIWRTRSHREGSFISVATNCWQLVVWSSQGRTHVTVRGPETKATIIETPADAHYFGIIFKLGTVLPPLLASGLVDSAVTLPEIAPGRVCINGSSWDVPTFENADAFIAALVREGVLIRPDVASAGGLGRAKSESLRSTQRRFVRATGLTKPLVRQIDRARSATVSLQQGASIADTAHELGYFDQPHLTRSLKRFVGQTPGQLLDQNCSEEMSLLYKRDASPLK